MDNRTWHRSRFSSQLRVRDIIIYLRDVYPCMDMTQIYTYTFKSLDECIWIYRAEPTVDEGIPIDTIR